MLERLAGMDVGQWHARFLRLFNGAERRGARSRFLVRAVFPVEILLTVMLAYVCADVAWVWLKPSGTEMGGGVTAPSGLRDPGGPAVDRDTLANFDPFTRNFAVAGPSEAARPAEPETSLKLKLYGVRAGDGENASAIIETPDNQQNAYRTGEEVMNNVTLVRVLPNRVVISSQGVRESLYLDERAKGDADGLRTMAPATEVASVAPGGPARVINQDSLLGQMRLVPRLESGRITGVRIYPRGDGRLFETLGLKADDILMAVNGHSIDGTDSIRRLGEVLRDEKSLRLNIERSGTRQTLDITLRK